MGGDALLNVLAELFRTERKQGGLYVDAICLVAAYGGMVGESYILGVSAPKLGYGSCTNKTDCVIDLLFDKLSDEQRSLIDRVRVYDSLSELDRHARCNFDGSYYGYCEAPLSSNIKLLEEATA